MIESAWKNGGNGGDGGGHNYLLQMVIKEIHSICLFN